MKMSVVADEDGSPVVQEAVLVSGYCIAVVGGFRCQFSVAVSIGPHYTLQQIATKTQCFSYTAPGHGHAFLTWTSG